MANTNSRFLCRRIKELREKNGLTMEEMARLLNRANKSSISRAEAGKTGYPSLLGLAKEYCAVFQMDSAQTEQFLRGDRIVIPDTSALLSNPQLIDELNREYSRVIIPKTVIDELGRIKNRHSGSLSSRAWEIIRSIGNGSRTLQRDCHGETQGINNDCKIIRTAREVSEEFACEVDIITNDADYSAYLKGDETVKALPLREYLAARQELVSLTRIREINSYYAESYEDIRPPSVQEANAYFDDGNTLIIAAVRNRSHSFSERREKIRWLIRQGADVNKRDCGRRYFPPLSHAIQMGDPEMFRFLLIECHANPNTASRNPFDSSRLRQKNEGNTPLMIAAWEGRDDMVRALCEDPRISINQQDANGFTALIKACANQHCRCRDILLEHGADRKIQDIEGRTFLDHTAEAARSGPLRQKGRRKQP